MRTPTAAQGRPGDDGETELLGWSLGAPEPPRLIDTRLVRVELLRMRSMRPKAGRAPFARLDTAQQARDATAP